MVRQPDYVYGIVPARGEYGFEIQPEHDIPHVLARVQSLTSSFQWNSADNREVAAIAVDQAQPPLVARFAIDTGDPARRLSLCMDVWIVSEKESVESILDALWPSSVILPVTRSEFIHQLGSDSGLRLIVGPRDTFTAVAFDRTWGGAESRSQHTTAKRSAARSTSKSVKPPPTLWITLLGCLLIAFAAASGFAVYQSWEIERLRTSDVKLTEDMQLAEADVALLQERLDIEIEATKRKSEEITTANHLLGQFRKETELQKTRIAELESRQPENPERAALANPKSNHTLQIYVEEYIASQKNALAKLQQAITDHASGPE